MNIEQHFEIEQRREDRKPDLYLAVVLLWLAIVFSVICAGCSCPCERERMQTMRELQNESYWMEKYFDEKNRQDTTYIFGGWKYPEHRMVYPDSITNMPRVKLLQYIEPDSIGAARGLPR